MTEDDIAYLRSLVPDGFTIPKEITQEEMLKLHMVSLQMSMRQTIQLQATIDRVNAYTDRAEATLAQLEKQLEKNDESAHHLSNRTNL